MHRNVEIVIGRLATDPRLRRRFVADRSAVLGELVGQGLELSPVESAALATLDADALCAFAGSLDGRLRRAHLGEIPSPGGADLEETIR